MTTSSQRVLQVLGTRLGVIKTTEIASATGLSCDQVHSGVGTLVRRGYAQRRGEGRVKATAAGLSFLEAGKEINSGPKGPRIVETEGSSLRSRLWRALRLTGKATIAELLELAGRGSERDAEGNAKEYLNALVKSGHVMRMSRRAEPEWPATTGATRYSLVLNTGPKPPQLNRRKKRVFDPNTGETFDVA